MAWPGSRPGCPAAFAGGAPDPGPVCCGRGRGSQRPALSLCAGKARPGSRPGRGGRRALPWAAPGKTFGGAEGPSGRSPQRPLLSMPVCLAVVTAVCDEVEAGGERNGRGGT